MGDQPLLVAPAISVIVAELRKRPEWQKDRPFKVPAELYREAETEMRAILKKRGFSLGRSKTVEAENFLIYGTVIIPNG